MNSFQQSLKVVSASVRPIGRVTPQGFMALGTCFLTNKPGFLATALHVTQSINTGLVVMQPPLVELNEYQRTLETARGTEVTIVEVDPVTDICIVKATGNSSARMSIRPVGLDNIELGETVCITGYPHATDNRIVFTYQEAILGAKIMLNPAGIDVKGGVVNIQTRPGQSGSPVFRKSNWDLIGVLTGAYRSPNSLINTGDFDISALNQTSIVVSSEYINLML